MPTGIELIHDDFRHVLPNLPDDESVNLFMCDFPYHNEYEYLYPPLAEQAARLFVPGGSLIALHGHRQHLRVGNILSQHLTLGWPIVKGHKNNLKPLREYKVASGMTQAWWFFKGDEPVVHHRPMDLLQCDEDHVFHEWGQDIR